ncbi:MAG: hypothetical protein ACM3PY_14025 [Omnitrophica WOR_2 bacterium]
MSEWKPVIFSELYSRFQSPISKLDCGKKCAPYNENGVPFCCDTRHAVPTAYQAEWEYLQASTDLWRPWQSSDPEETRRLRQQTPAGQTLIACQGHLLCQRGFRSLTCRAFPFFPYINPQSMFIGLSYYWEYEDRCWVISNLEAVTPAYRAEFFDAYDQLFIEMPDEKENFRHHSAVMRRIFSRRHRTIPLLHRNGKAYKISPGSGRMRCVSTAQLPKFGPYQIASMLPFPDELDG